MEKLHLNWLVAIFYEKNRHVFFNKQPSCKRSNVKNSLKVNEKLSNLLSNLQR